MIARIGYTEVTHIGGCRCIVGIAWAEDEMTGHLVGIGWGETQPEALADALSYGERALAAVKGEISTMIARIVYTELAIYWQCNLIVHEPGDHTAHDVGRGWGKTKPEALDAAISFAERALAAVKAKANVQAGG